MSLDLAVALVTILGGGGLIGLWHNTKPGRDRNAAVADAILGKAAVLDRAGGVIEESQPGLVDRTGTLERAVALMANQDARITRNETRLDGHDDAIAQLIAAQFERGAQANLAAAEKLRNKP